MCSARSYGSTFDAFRTDCSNEWRKYVQHEFVEQVRNAELPRSCYIHYLVQDWLYLVHFARAWALFAAKSDSIDRIQVAANTLSSIVNVEVAAHERECAQYGIDKKTLQSTPERTATVAYTRFVIDIGVRGDALDLLVALVPCVLGYGEIGTRLGSACGGSDLKKHPYAQWISEYAHDDYQLGCERIGKLLDEEVREKLGANPQESPRWNRLVRIFHDAVRLEIAFWEMALSP